MLGSDNEESARKMSEMFDDPRVKQYWDPKRLLGTSYSTHVFPSYLVDIGKGMDAALPADHWWRDQKRNWKDVNPEQAPLWDVAFTYDKGTTWDKVPPVPHGMVKQVFFYGDQADGPTGMFFTDFKRVPRDGDWIKEVASAMTQLIGSAPKKPSSPSATKPSAPLADCAGGSMKAKLIALKLSGVAESKTKAVEESATAMNGVIKATYDADSQLLTVLAAVEGALTPDRLLKSLTLAGYEAREASEAESEQAIQAIMGGGAMMIRQPAKARKPNYPDSIAGLMARAFIEAFNSGDPEKVREAAEAYRSKSTLESRSMDERLDQYRQLYKDWGQLEVQAFEEHDDGSLTLTVKPDRGFSGLNMTFSFEKAGGKIDQIRIIPTMSLDENGVDAKSGVAAEITVLSGSIDPLRQHFNAHKDKHRFIAILSPT